MKKLINQIKESNSQLIGELEKIDRSIEIDEDIFWEFPSFTVAEDFGYTRYYITRISEGKIFGKDLDSGDEFVNDLAWMSISEVIKLAEFLLEE